MSVTLDEKERELSNLLVVRDKDGRIALMIGLFVTVYFDKQLTRPVREAVVAVAEDYIKVVREHLRWAEPPMKNRYAPVTSKRVKLPGVWLPDHPDGKSWHLEFHGGETSDAASTFLIDAFGSNPHSDGGLGYVHVSFPLLWFATHPGTLLDYVRTICDRLRPLSGYAGIGVLEPSDGYVSNKFQGAVRLFAERYPGLEIENRVGHLNYLLDGIKGVNWLTIVGDRWLSELGGLSNLKGQLSDGLALYPYDGGAILQAGPKPEIGDVEANRWPEHYIAAAKLLKKVQIKKHRSFHFGEAGHMTNESSQAWLFRFDNK